MASKAFVQSAAGRLSRQSLAVDLSRASRRTYATEGRPPLPQAGRNNNQGLAMGLALIAVPALAYFVFCEPQPTTASAKQPALDPATRTKAKKEEFKDTPGRGGHIHPEHEDPELKAPFGVVHKQKRVDENPDERNHNAINQRNRQA